MIARASDSWTILESFLPVPGVSSAGMPGIGAGMATANSPGTSRAVLSKMMCSGPIAGLPSQSSSARRITFSSSRTLPGQPWALSMDNAASEIQGTGLPCGAWRSASAKARGAMSSARSRSGFSESGKTLRR
jgi:hypothetical protein